MSSSPLSALPTSEPQPPEPACNLEPRRLRERRGRWRRGRGRSRSAEPSAAKTVRRFILPVIAVLTRDLCYRCLSLFTLGYHPAHAVVLLSCAAAGGDEDGDGSDSSDIEDLDALLEAEEGA